MQKVMNIILTIFFIVQPLFDLKIFYNSISTLIRVIIVGILFLLYFILNKNKKKYLLFIYLFILILYTVLHHINALSFKSLIPGNFNYSFLNEVLYLVKMITPFLLIFVLFNSNLHTNEIIKIIRILTSIIGLIIIISNLFVFSYSSYNDQIIKANFFSWFNNNNNYTYQELSSKGLFEYANQISAVLLMFLPFSLISFIEKKSLNNFFVLFINMFALFLLSTKVAVFGVLIVFIYVIVTYIFNNKLLKKGQVSYHTLTLVICFILLYSVLLPINPSFNRINENKAIVASSDTIIENISDNTSSDSVNNPSSQPMSDIDYIQNNYNKMEIKEEFITKKYPYQNDPEFWINIMNQPRYKRVNYRFLELSMIKRVVEINNNKLDILLGITNTRLQNIFNIEKDFIVQYYALGIIGLIIVFVPYFAMLCIYLYKIIKSKFKCFNTLNFVTFITILMIFGVSYYSGNLLNSLSFTMYFTLLYKLLFDNIQKKEK